MIQGGRTGCLSGPLIVVYREPIRKLRGPLIKAKGATGQFRGPPSCRLRAHLVARRALRATRELIR